MNCNEIIGEVKMYGGAVAPFYHEFCTGQFLDKVVYKNLYSVIGDKYNTINTPVGKFSLPNMVDKFPVMKGLGDTGGSNEVTLTVNHLPSHSHDINCDSNTGDTVSPIGSILADAAGLDKDFSTKSPNSKMSNNSISHTGGGQAFDNLPPYLGINFIIYTGVL